MLIIWCILIFTCIINVIMIYKHGYAFDFFDIIWPLCFITYILAISNLLLAKIIFKIHDDLLTVTKRTLFNKKIKIYNIGQMKDLEIEEIIVKKYLFYPKEPSGEYNITFFYNEKEEKLGAIPAKVYTEQLLNAILAVKT